MSRLLRRTLPPVLISCSALVVSCIAVEVVLRLVIVMSESRPQWSDRPTFYVKARGASSMQDAPYSPTKPDRIFRIAVVGDSFSFAPYMQFFDTFPKKLEQLLNLNFESKRVEVINYGVPAYSASHEIAVVEQAIQESADLIILQVTLNDPELKLHRPTGIAENMEDRFAPWKPSSRMEKVCRLWSTPCFIMTRLGNTRTRNAYVEYFLGLHNNPKTWGPYEHATKGIIRRCRKAKTPIVAVVFPLFGLPFDESYPFLPIHEKVRKLFLDLQTPHLDLSELYKGIPLDRLQVIPGGDRHPNEIAHRMAAETLYLWLHKLEVLPSETYLNEVYRTRLGVLDQSKLEALPTIPGD
jgi:hypothetical protein